MIHRYRLTYYFEDVVLTIKTVAGNNNYSTEFMEKLVQKMSRTSVQKSSYFAKNENNTTTNFTDFIKSLTNYENVVSVKSRRTTGATSVIF